MPQTHLSPSIAYCTMIDEATSFIRNKFASHPSIGIILGTGLGAVAQHIIPECVIEYHDIPHFPLSTVESHTGRLIIGTLSGKTVIAMQGRFHYYEGYTMQEITFPIRVLYALGISTLLVSNACGALNPEFSRSDIMIIEDHINLLGDNPLIGQNLSQFGPRFPDMSMPYHQGLISIAEQCAAELHIPIKKGVYVSVPGPNLETRAEYRFLRMIGADVVGMSTIPEVIVACHMNMRVIGFSIITDECFSEFLQPVTMSEIIEAAEKAEPNLVKLITSFIQHV